MWNAIDDIQKHKETQYEPTGKLKQLNVDLDGLNYSFHSRQRIGNTEFIALGLMLFFGLAFMWFGYDDWYKRVQKPLDQRTLLELELLKMDVADKRKERLKEIY